MKMAFTIPNPFYGIGKWITRCEYSVRTKYEPTKPRLDGCDKGPYGLHKWEWSQSWNGNDRRVLPFETRTDGIGRAGHRCYHCGRMIWQKSDEEFALFYAHKLGYIPGSRHFLLTGEWPETNP